MGAFTLAVSAVTVIYGLLPLRYWQMCEGLEGMLMRRELGV